jgi:hypothetical protein
MRNQFSRTLLKDTLAPHPTHICIFQSPTETQMARTPMHDPETTAPIQSDPLLLLYVAAACHLTVVDTW